MITGAFHWTTEARAYSLVLGLGALALVSWQTALETAGRRRAIALLLMVGAIAAAICAHYYAVQIVLALFVGELVRASRTRTIDWPVWLGFIAGLSPLVVLTSLASTTSNAIFSRIHNSPGFAYSSRLSSPYHFFQEIIAPAASTLLIATIVVLCTRAGACNISPVQRLRRGASYPAHEIA